MIHRRRADVQGQLKRGALRAAHPLARLATSSSKQFRDGDVEPSRARRVARPDGFGATRAAQGSETRLPANTRTRPAVAVGGGLARLRATQTTRRHRPAEARFALDIADALRRERLRSAVGHADAGAQAAERAHAVAAARRDRALRRIAAGAASRLAEGPVTNRVAAAHVGRRGAHAGADQGAQPALGESEQRRRAKGVRGLSRNLDQAPVRQELKPGLPR